MALFQTGSMRVDAVYLRAGPAKFTGEIFNRDKKLLKIYGERNTATKYMSQLIKLNLDVQEVPGILPWRIAKLQSMLPENEWLMDLYFLITFKHNLGWKHVRVEPKSLLRKHDILGSNLCFVTITKNPYAWLLSLYRRPYHQGYKNKPDFETFLRTPWKTVARDNCRKIANPTELWNVKNSSYLELTAFVDVLNLKSESILQDPRAVIDNISNRFDIGKISEQFINCHDSTEIDSDKNFIYYQDYYLNERWRESLSKNAIEIINETLDNDLMNKFGYKILI
jgi:hypothetical protein